MTVDKTGVDKLGINRTQWADEPYSYVPLRLVSRGHTPFGSTAKKAGNFHFVCVKIFHIAWLIN